MHKPSAPRGFYLMNKIGTGAYADVWLAQHVNLQKNVAIKIIPKHSVRKPTEKQRLDNEIAIQSKVQHPFIAPLFQVTENILHYFLVMEYVSGSTLLDRTLSKGCLRDNEARHYFIQILSALSYLHNDLHVIHRDIKAENILVDENNNIRLIDFGFSAELDKDESKCNTITSRLGSPNYLAPEVFDKASEEFTEAVDMWSLGVVLFTMVRGKFPFSAESIARLKDIVMNEELFYPDSMDHNLVSLLNGLLCKDPKRRLTAKQAQMHPWVIGEPCATIDNSLIFETAESIDSKIEKREKLTQKLANSGQRFIKINELSDEKSSENNLVFKEISSNNDGEKESDTQSDKMSASERLLASGRFKPLTVHHQREDSISRTLSNRHKRSVSQWAGAITQDSEIAITSSVESGELNENKK